MKTYTVLIALAALVVTNACKKSYSCNCSFPHQVTKSFTIEDNKSNAKTKCDAYFRSYTDTIHSYQDTLIKQSHCSVE